MGPKNLGPKISKSEKFWVQEKLNKEKIRVQTNFWFKKILVKKYQGYKKLGPKGLFKTMSVKAEILLIWKNVLRTNVA